jgi:hypothetical protein
VSRKDEEMAAPSIHNDAKRVPRQVKGMAPTGNDPVAELLANAF